MTVRELKDSLDDMDDELPIMIRGMCGALDEIDDVRSVPRWPMTSIGGPRKKMAMAVVISGKGS